MAGRALTRCLQERRQAGEQAEAETIRTELEYIRCVRPILVIVLILICLLLQYSLGKNRAAYSFSMWVFFRYLLCEPIFISMNSSDRYAKMLDDIILQMVGILDDVILPNFHNPSFPTGSEPSSLEALDGGQDSLEFLMGIGAMPLNFA